jgi:IclR family acetate operon transcriptional repressor
MIKALPRGAAAIDKALSLFLALADDGGATPLSVLARKAGIPTSTSHRIVGILLRAGVLGRVGRGRYAAGWRLGTLPCTEGMRAALIHAARDAVRTLARDLKVTVHLGVLEGDMVTYLVKEQGGGPDLITSEMSQLEAYCTGIGKVLLANLHNDARDAYLSSAPFVPLTSNTIIDPTVLRAQFVNRRGKLTP